MWKLSVLRMILCGLRYINILTYLLTY